MLIREYGLFWQADEIVWSPGRGTRFTMCGRDGVQRGTVRVADFRDQRGLYVLYGNYGPYYVGLTEKMGLGDRLRDHHNDRHARQWDRFSWFGFRRILKQRDDLGLNSLANLATVSSGGTKEVIRDMESLLIKALGTPFNFSDTKFPAGQEWKQVRKHEIDTYLAKVAP